MVAWSDEPDPRIKSIAIAAVAAIGLGAAAYYVGRILAARRDEAEAPALRGPTAGRPLRALPREAAEG